MGTVKYSLVRFREGIVWCCIGMAWSCDVSHGHSLVKYSKGKVRFSIVMAQYGGVLFRSGMVKQGAVWFRMGKVV